MVYAMHTTPVILASPVTPTMNEPQVVPIPQPPPAIEIGEDGIPNDPRALLVNAFWLVGKLSFMLYIFAHNGNYIKTALFYFLALFIFVVQMGLVTLPNFGFQFYNGTLL
jgi:hypothetical protein